MSDEVLIGRSGPENLQVFLVRSNEVRPARVIPSFDERLPWSGRGAPTSCFDLIEFCVIDHGYSRHFLRHPHPVATVALTGPRDPDALRWDRDGATLVRCGLTLFGVRFPVGRCGHSPCGASGSWRSPRVPRPLAATCTTASAPAPTRDLRSTRRSAMPRPRVDRRWSADSARGLSSVGRSTVISWGRGRR